MSEFVVEPFTNEFGQVINPGEEVIFAGSSWNQTYIRKGVFAGVRYDNVTRTNYLKDENGELIKEEIKSSYGGSTYYRYKSESVTTREVVAVRVEKVNRGKKWGYVDGKYTMSDEDHYGVSTLPLKRVYKLDTSMNNLVGMSI